jgi:hypothetical protein
MTIRGKGVLLAVGLLGSILAAATPAWAQSGHGGGGHGGGGGGGHASGGGGGHASGGGGGHASAGGGHSYGGSHGSPSQGVSGAHYATAAHYGGSAVHGYSGAYHGASYAGHGANGYGYPGHYYGYGHGYSTGAYWRGGYWHGGYWPRCNYGWGFAWFLPVLPLAYATYWYGSVPYYYANDVYYTYNPSYDGYVATDPPPVADSSATGAGAAPDTGAQAPLSAPSSGAAFGPGVGQIFMYPKNGQSPEQQATDKAECQKWASEQAGQVAQNAPDYQRAMVACVEGRGYSAR